MTSLLSRLKITQPVKRLYQQGLLWFALRLTTSPKIILGASTTRYRGWISTNIEGLNILNPQDWQRYFRPNSIAALLAEHVWEHLTESNGLQAAILCFEFLKRDGYLRIAVPDGFHPDPAYRELVRPNGTGAGAQDHKVFYTYETLGVLLQQAGFKPLFLEYFDETGKFHESDWDPEMGPVLRSARFDARNHDGQLKYTSLIVDAIKV